MDRARYRPHLTATLALGLPLIGAHLARMAVGVTDTIMVGWYGVEALAALVLATSFVHLLFFLGMGYGIGVMGLIATAIARGDETEVRRATRMALWLSLGHGVLVMPILWWSQPILIALGQTPEVAGLAQDYLRIAGWAMGANLAALTLNSYLAALEKPNVVLWITVAGIPVNAFLNWVLIFGNLGAPEMGVRGSATATLIVQLATLGALAGYAAWLPMARRFVLFQRFWKPDWVAMRAVIRLGLPIGLTMVAEGGLFIATSVMMGWIGVKPLAAHGIALQITAMGFMVPLGLSNAATVRVGQAKGRADATGLREAALVAVALAGSFGLMTAALFLSLPEGLVRLFLDPLDPATPALIALAAGLMFYAALFQIADVLQVVTLGLLRGVHDTGVPMWIAGFSYWAVGMPLAYGLGFLLPGGPWPGGLWLGLVAGLSLAAALLSARFWRGVARGAWTA